MNLNVSEPASEVANLKGPAGPYHRVLLKLSGEALAGPKGYGIDQQTLMAISSQIKRLRLELDVQIGVVIGGGNIWRGTEAAQFGMDRAQADYAGMLGTIINALAFQDALERSQVTTRVQTAINVYSVAEPYIRRRAIRHLEKGRVVVFAGGTGNPYFSTDTAAALRAVEISAQIILMGKNGTDGVYDADPRVTPSATKIDRLGYSQALNQGLGVMDATALSMCMENNLPIVVFDINVEGNIIKAVRGEKIGSLIH